MCFCFVFVGCLFFVFFFWPGVEEFQQGLRFTGSGDVDGEEK